MPIAAIARPISSMPGVSTIIWWNSSVMPSGQPKYQAIRVNSYGMFETAAIRTAQRPQRSAPAGVIQALTGLSPRPQLMQASWRLR
ncbi:hypothetical protein GCM10009789_69000 [Kribbella sancticallisti]|uniref:Uncharacterized protein n=1 Tax=Kribbella sancticallisti TaxID=460087 RepID=A0ABN2EHA7_9ACTN